MLYTHTHTSSAYDMFPVGNDSFGDSSTVPFMLLMHSRGVKGPQVEKRIILSSQVAHSTSW